MELFISTKSRVLSDWLRNNVAYVKEKTWEATGPTEKNKDNSVTKKSKNFVLQFTFSISSVA